MNIILFTESVCRCDFMNFAKNMICLQCDAKRPKRQLLPREWECPRLAYLFLLYFGVLFFLPIL
jgi:hypothetical protein